jgi:hypothetical protein
MRLFRVWGWWALSDPANAVPVGQQIFDIAGVQVEVMVEPNRVLNDLRRKSMAFIQRCGSFHPAIVV